MNKLIKICVIVAAFTLAAGCAKKPATPSQEQTPAVQAKEVKHPSRHCKGKHCADKLGTKATEDTAK